jgi:hypothetical protein
MSVFSKFENKIEDVVDGAAGAVFKAPIEPAQIAKRAEKQMKRERLVGSGRQYAPTLYNVLVNANDDKRLFGFYPTMASEIETYLYAKGTDAGLDFVTRPLVRFIVDKALKPGKFDVIAEAVSAPIIKELRDEELEYYGLKPKAAEKPAPAVPAADAAVDVADAIADAAASAVSAAESAALAAREPLDGLDVHVNPQDDVLDSSSGDDTVAATTQNPTDTDDIDPAIQPALGNAKLFNASTGRSIHLERRLMTIGRGKDNAIVLADANASRVHARFSQDAIGKWKLTDLNSTNGTLLNGRPVKVAILRDGDELTIGMTLLEFKQ